MNFKGIKLDKHDFEFRPVPNEPAEICLVGGPVDHLTLDTVQLKN